MLEMLFLVVWVATTVIYIGAVALTVRMARGGGELGDVVWARWSQAGILVSFIIPLVVAAAVVAAKLGVFAPEMPDGAGENV